MKLLRLLTLLCILLAGSTTDVSGQAVDIVRKYNNCLKGFINDGDVEYLETIDEMLRGGDVKCIINNSLAKEFAREKKWNEMTMHSDTYHNELSNHHDIGKISSVELTDYELLADWVEPRIKTSEFRTPTVFVAAKMNVAGQKQYAVRDLFFVQGNHIVMIDDYGDSESLAKAIECYNTNRYDEAFRIFRKHAYINRGSRKAQYYYVVMLIKGQGCKHLPKKVRDLEAAWFALGGMRASDRDLSDLATKFSMHLPATTFETVWLYEGVAELATKNRQKPQLSQAEAFLCP